MNIFGTDGVRGLANSGFITPDNIVKLAISVINFYIQKNHQTVNNKFTVIVGKDTRLSGYMLEPALTAGLISAGADVVLLGPVPTPAVAFLTRSLRADLGIMISASHNPYYDNGIKFFNSHGVKISIADELTISSIFKGNQILTSHAEMGRAKRLKDVQGRYIEFVKNSFPKNMTLAGLKIILDTANGAGYKIAPKIFWELGAEIIIIGDEPDGININQNCGTADVFALQQKVVDERADIGLALDGDADRLIIVDETGAILDGDYILAAIATSWNNLGKLINKNIIATHISNLALEKYLYTLGLQLIRVDVGDKHVHAKMQQLGAILGGEKSGHIIPIEYVATSDGLIAALQVLAFLKQEKKKTSAIRTLFNPFPQIFKNISKDFDSENLHVASVVQNIKENILKNNGRIFIRKSGTENVTRIMIEAPNHEDILLAYEKLNTII